MKKTTTFCYYKKTLLQEERLVRRKRLIIMTEHPVITNKHADITRKVSHYREKSILLFA